MKEHYTKESQCLMESWKEEALHKGCVFVEDGIIDFDKWSTSPKKILVLLKEAYGREKEWSLAEAIRDEWCGPKFKIWNTVAYWLYCLQNTDKSNIPLLPKSKEELARCSEALLSSAVVNIKKSSGKSRSSFDDLKNYANADKQYLVNQIKLINPDIILCGYTKDLLEMIWEEKLVKLEETEFIYKAGNLLVIDYWHPANQYPDKLQYYTLGALYQKTL